MPQPDWLIYLNQLRAMAGVPPVVEDQTLSMAAKAHAVYMVRTDDATAHSEDSSSPHYSAEGAAAARSADIFATTQVDGNYDWALNFWMSGPFHVLQLIDPLQVSVGFGQHQEATGHIQMAAVLDTARGDKLPDSSAEFPRYFPPDGGQTWIVRKSLYEWPEPFGGCAGYGFQPPSGPPVIVQLGTGNITPRVTSYRLLRGDTVVESCLLTETTYVHPNIYTQEFGRSLLDARDAVILLPLHPLEGNQIYTAKLTINGVDHEWSFSVVDRPPLK